MVNLIQTYVKLGEFQKMHELYDFMLDEQKQLVGYDHPAILTSIHQLAEIYSEMGEYRKVEELNLLVLERQKIL